MSVYGICPKIRYTQPSQEVMELASNRITSVMTREQVIFKLKSKKYLFLFEYLTEYI